MQGNGLAIIEEEEKQEKEIWVNKKKKKDKNRMNNLQSKDEKEIKVIDENNESIYLDMTNPIISTSSLNDKKGKYLSQKHSHFSTPKNYNLKNIDDIYEGGTSGNIFDLKTTNENKNKKEKNNNSLEVEEEYEDNSEEYLIDIIEGSESENCDEDCCDDIEEEEEAIEYLYVQDDHADDEDLHSSIPPTNISSSSSSSSSSSMGSAQFSSISQPHSDFKKSKL
jgi:hypothetical protein